MRLLQLICLCLAFGPLCTESASAAEEDRATVAAEDNAQPLVNPEMGRTMHFYSNIISFARWKNTTPPTCRFTGGRASFSRRTAR
jgi:hypothetical protein